MKKFLAIDVGADVEADSHEAAAKLFLSHLNFTKFSGAAVEVVDCMAISGT